MKLSKRATDVINLLRGTDHYLTSTEIASQLLISTKTIGRLIHKINAGTSSGKLIAGVKGQGYKLNYSNYLSEVIGGQIRISETQISAVERQRNSLEQLLKASPRALKNQDLFGDYYVSESVINQDIKAIRDVLRAYDIKLQNKAHRLNVVGTEHDVRRALQDIFFDRNIIDIDLSLDKHGEINTYSMDLCRTQLQLIERELETNISYPYNINILSHLYILVTRYQSGGTEPRRSVHLGPEALQVIVDNQTLYQVAQDVIVNVEGFLNTAIPESEIYNLLQYLLSSRLSLHDQVSMVVSQDKKVRDVTSFYIQEVGALLDLQTDAGILLGDLAKHIRPMINRLEHHIGIRNVLLEDIQQEYPGILKAVSKVSSRVATEFDLPEISIDENGFISLYFAKYFEQSRQNLQALVVCTTGLATSKLIETKVGMAFPEVVVIGTGASKDVTDKTVESIHANLVISTVLLNKVKTIPVVIVSAMLTRLDKERIRSVISRMRGSEKMLSDITNPQLIQVGLQVTDWRDAVRKSATPFINEGVATSSYVEGMITTAEESGPYIVISKGIALPHARPELGVKKLVLQLPPWLIRLILVIRTMIRFALSLPYVQSITSRI
ncbi:hypothetical protein ATO00_08845 [Loigolactobacillus coryniformis subsp. coryniformis]|nr:hypothetical protein ATO00_08845 [Loigolactobacillus coryniformis subsp. coryniformis]